MKIKKLKIVVPFFLLISGLFFGQFNTLLPTQPKKEKPESSKIVKTEKDEDNAKQKKDKNLWKKIFNNTTKSDLKNEIDSLKMLMKDYSSINANRQLHYQKMKDSLLLLSQSRVQEKKENSKRQNLFTKYDFVEEPREIVSKIVMPVRNGLTITSSYGTRTHPIFGTKKMHNGIDLKANYENVYSVMDGIVTAAGWDSKGGGNFMKVRHFNRFETSYLHLSEIYYKPGEKVTAGYVIGKSGNSGNSTGPHLHFSVKEFGQSINPAHFLNDLIKVNNLIATYNE